MRINEFMEIPNVKFNVKAILDDLKLCGCITKASSMYISGRLEVYKI